MHRDGTPDEFDRDREEFEDRQARANTVFKLYECLNCLEHVRVYPEHAGYSLRCPVCGHCDWTRKV